MTQTIDIPASETGVVRVLALDLPPEAIGRYTDQAGTGEWPLQYGLGASVLRPTFIEVLRLKDLGEMSLSRYLSEAYNIADRDLDEAARRSLDVLTGHVVILPSQAFDATAQTLSVSSPLRLVGTFSEPRATRRQAPVRTPSAQGGIESDETAPEPRGKGGSAILRAILVAVGVVLVAIVIWAVARGG